MKAPFFYGREEVIMKTFRVQIRAYGYYADFDLMSEDSDKAFENALVDKLGKGDIKWEHLGEMFDPRVNRITYEEVINGGDNATSGDPLHKEEGTRSSMGAGAS